MKLSSQAGITMVEVLISLGILGVVFVGGGLKMKNVSERLDRVRISQSSDALQSFLRSALTAKENIKHSVQFLPMGDLRSCLENRNGCRDVIEGPISAYLVGDTDPITGPNVRYSRDGVPCYTKDCGPLSVESKIRLFCSAGGYLKQGCNKAKFMAIQYTIRDEGRRGNNGGGILISDAVEVADNEASYVEDLTLTCLSGSVIRGIGLTGNALCTNFGAVAYNDSGTMKPGDFEVKPKDCRPTKKEAQTQKQKQKQKQTVMQKQQQLQPDGTTIEVEVPVEVEVEVEVDVQVEVDVPVADSDEKYVDAIDADGTIHCADKTW